MYKLILPVRFMLKRRITILAVASIALCVFITLVVMTVHNGIVSEFKEKNHSFAGDCVIGTDSLVGFAYYEDFLAELKSKPFIFAAAPAIKSFGLLNQPGSDINIGIGVTGIAPGEFSTDYRTSLSFHQTFIQTVRSFSTREFLVIEC